MSSETPAYIKIMHDELTALFQTFPGTCAVGYVNLDDHSRLLLNEEIPLRTASTAKALLLGEIFQQARTGNISFSRIFQIDIEAMAKRLDLSNLEDSTYLTGHLAKQGYSGKKISAWELIEFMLTYSDNFATSMLLLDTNIFAEGVLKRFSCYGPMGFVANRFFRSGECPPALQLPDGSAYSKGTAKGYMDYLMDVCHGRWCDSPAACETMLCLLGHAGNISGADMGVISAVKMGGNNRTSCRAGVCLGPGKRFVFVVIVNPEHEHNGKEYGILGAKLDELEKVIWEHTPRVNKGLYRIPGIKGIAREEWIDAPCNRNLIVHQTFVYGGSPNMEGLRLCLMPIDEGNPRESFDGKFKLILSNTGDIPRKINVFSDSSPVAKLDVFAPENRRIPWERHKYLQPIRECELKPGKAIISEYNLEGLAEGRYCIRATYEGLDSNWLVVNVVLPASVP